MKNDDSYERRRQAARGLLLVAAGGALLLDRFDYIDLAGNWHYWVLLLVPLGINRAIGAPGARDLLGGLWTAAAGVVLFAGFEGLFGLSLWNCVPVFIIMSGVMIALRPFAARHVQSSQEAGNENQ